MWLVRCLASLAIPHRVSSLGVARRWRRRGGFPCQLLFVELLRPCADCVILIDEGVRDWVEVLVRLLGPELQHLTPYGNIRIGPCLGYRLRPGCGGREGMEMLETLAQFQRNKQFSH